jgi:REP element-mobilizing transposase RayT
MVFSTKNRSRTLSPAIQDELHPYIAGTLNNHKCPSLQVGGVEDHVHLLFQLSRTMSISQVAEKVKTSSTKWIKEKWPDKSRFAWQIGYGAFSVGMGEISIVRDYIQAQARHHHEATFQEEFRALMAAAGIEIDERYAWDWLARPFRPPLGGWFVHSWAVDPSFRSSVLQTERVRH